MNIGTLSILPPLENLKAWHESEAISSPSDRKAMHKAFTATITGAILALQASGEKRAVIDAILKADDEKLSQFKMFWGGE